MDDSREIAGPAALLELRGLRKSFGSVKALNGVDLAIRAGEIHAIVGENGAGKSTLIGICAGILAADGGTILFEGIEAVAPEPRRMREIGVGVAYQHPALAADLTVLENLQLASPELAARDGAAEAERLLR